jgi:GT2 family glycosyltransferase
MTLPPLVYILLLNFRGTEHTLACLDSLRSLDYANFRIVVIDNASPDNSVERLKARLQAYPDEFQLIESDKNLGYSGGNNLGIRAVLKDSAPESDAYIWLLNNDTTVAPDALTHLVSEAQRTGGLAGSLLLFPDGSYQQVGTRMKWWTGGSKGYPASAVQDEIKVETLSGASMLIPFKALNKAGLLNESFFLYFEDGEASLRYAQAGFPLTVAAQSQVYHMEGATTGRKSLSTQYYFHRNRLRLLIMYANPLQKLTILGYAMFRLLRSIVKSRLNSDPERRVSAKVHHVAVKDFLRGVSGPCPHNLEGLR